MMMKYKNSKYHNNCTLINRIRHKEGLRMNKYIIFIHSLNSDIKP